jgi:hypothetical protein
MSLNCSQIAIGSRVRDSISESLVGDIAAIGIYARSVTPLEGRALTANIWQLFRPRTLRIYSLPASGIPVLSGSTVIDIGQTSARPRVTITF